MTKIETLIPEVKAEDYAGSTQVLLNEGVTIANPFIVGNAKIKTNEKPNGDWNGRQQISFDAVDTDTNERVEDSLRITCLLGVFLEASKRANVTLKKGDNLSAHTFVIKAGKMSYHSAL